MIHGESCTLKIKFRMGENTMSTFNDLDTTSTVKAHIFHNTLRENSVNFASGVPCGVIRHIISNIDTDENILHVPANRESEAVGIVAGASLAGKTPILYMQNSGFFAASNDIASLLIPYKIPVLIIMSYRGCEGEDAPQHLITGKSTLNILRSFELEYEVYSSQNIKELVDNAFIKMHYSQLPYVILLKRGWYND
jgi:sulfopyruvate decarboxylase alpha subunit